MLQIKLLFLLFFTKVHICWVKELKCNLEANKNLVIWDTSHGHVTVSGHLITRLLSPILPSCGPLYFWLHHEKMWFNNWFLKICKLNCCFHAAINNPCTVFSIFPPQYLETTRKQLTAINTCSWWQNSSQSVWARLQRRSQQN